MGFLRELGVPGFVKADVTDPRDAAAGEQLAQAIDAINVGQLQGFKNRLINGGFCVAQRTAASNADDTYTPVDRWYALTQTDTIAVSQLTNPENGAITGVRLTQSQATAQRMGLAQIIESANCRDLRTAVTTLAGRARLSSADDVRYAVLEWTGTADSVTSDVVNDWTSADYSAGEFFISSNVNVLAVGVVACAADTWRDLEALGATLGATANNVIVLIWTENEVAQNVTLDLNRVQFEPGAEATAYELRPRGIENVLCQRYFQLAGFGAVGRVNNTTTATIGAPFAVRMRGVATVALVNTGLSIRTNGNSTATASGSAITASLAQYDGWYAQINGFTGLTAADGVHGLSVGAFSFDAEL